ncbi:MAG: hypothetical protein Q9212_001878 [Teloschistes hypoglaucus]
MERKAGSGTQLTVDEAILDYLIYTAVKAQLQEDYDATMIANHLEMVDCKDKYLQPLVFSKNKRQTGEICDMEYLCPGKADVMSLQETLPLFLALSALQNSIQESTITELWMRLAAGYMAQAYAEQVLTCQGDRLGLLEGLFDWGMSFESSRRSTDGSDEFQIMQMFNADEHVLERWEDMKAEHIDAVSVSLIRV